MRHYTFATMTAGALLAAVLGFAGIASAAPSGPSSAADAVKQLQSQGYHVVINRIGSAPLSECTVASVTSGRAATTPTVVGSDDTEDRRYHSTVYLTAQC